MMNAILVNPVNHQSRFRFVEGQEKFNVMVVLASYLKLGITTSRMRDITDNSQPAGSWGRFAGRMYFLGDRNDSNSNAHLVNRSRDTIWCYIITSVIYFLLISVILVILLLAPKYRLSPESPSTIHPVNMSRERDHADGTSESHAETQSGGHGVGTGSVVGYHGGTGKDDINVQDIMTGSNEEEFVGSPKDPLYDIIDIDPRSSNFGEKTHKLGEHNHGLEEEDYPENRLRMNSKFLRE